MATSTVRQLRVSGRQHGAYPHDRRGVAGCAGHAVISIDAGEYAETLTISDRRLTLRAPGEVCSTRRGPNARSCRLEAATSGYGSYPARR